jgi:hypothetical protein
MADYAKLSIKGIYSKSTDYSDPVTVFSPDAYTITPDEYFHTELEASTGGGTTLDTSIVGAATLVVVKNNDTTNYVTATFGKTGSGSADTSVRIHAGGFFVTTDFTTTYKLKLAANTADCECEIFIVGT